jgi:hypothetical protein
MNTPFSIRFGQHLRVRRKGYYHHGLSMGNGRVIDFNNNFRNTSDGQIRITSLEEFLQGGDLEIIVHDHPKYPGYAAVQRGLERLGGSGYNLVFKNCEHFVNWCITGKAESSQVHAYSTLAGLLGLTLTQSNNSALKKFGMALALGAVLVIGISSLLTIFPESSVKKPV